MKAHWRGTILILICLLGYNIVSNNDLFSDYDTRQIFLRLLVLGAIIGGVVSVADSLAEMRSHKRRKDTNRDDCN